MRSNYYYCALLRVTVILLLFSFSRTSFAQEIPYQTMEIVGDAAISWDEGIEVDSIYIDSNEVVYEFYDIVLTEGNIKFRTDNTWNFNWGGTAFPEADLIFNGSNILISKADTFNIFLTFDAYDSTAYRYHFESLTGSSSSNLDTTTIGGVTAAEYNALVDIYHSLNGDNWTDNTNWLSDEDVSTWFGVTVVDGHVTHFNVGWNNASGVIPSSISDLSYATYLGFYINDISAMEDLDQPMPNVKELYINANNLTSLPSNLDLMDSLDILAIQNNLLDNSSFKVLKKIKSLSYLYAENSLYDPLWNNNKFEHLGLIELKNELSELETFTYANQDFIYCCGEILEEADSTTLYYPYFEDERFSAYQWYFEGDTIPSATTSTLKIKSSENIGYKYHLEAVDSSLTRLTLRTASLTNYGPTIRGNIVSVPSGTNKNDIVVQFFEGDYTLTRPIEYDSIDDIFYLKGHQAYIPQNYYFTLKGDDRFREVDSNGDSVIRQIDNTPLDFADTIEVSINEWSALPKDANTCETAEIISVGSNYHSESSPNWYSYKAEEGQNLFFKTDHPQMKVEVLEANCDSIILLSNSSQLNLNEGDSVLIRWYHEEGKDVIFDWSMQKSDYSIVTQLSDWSQDNAVVMEEIAPKEYEGYIVSNTGNANYILRDGKNIFRVDNTSDKSGLLRIYYNAEVDSLHYSLIEEIVFLPEEIYATDSTKEDNSIWFADEEITMELNLAGTYFEESNYDDAYIYFWLIDSASKNHVQSDLVNGDWENTPEKNKLTHLVDSIYSFTFTPSEFINVDPKLIEEFGFSFLIKSKNGRLKSIDSTYPIRSNEKEEKTWQVNLSVDMSLAIEYGLFDANKDSLAINSNVDQENYILLSDTDKDLIYDVTIDSIMKPLFNFKTMILGEEMAIEYAKLPAREYLLDSTGIQNISVWYDDENGNYPATTFTVDMEKEIKLGRVDPLKDDVQLILYDNGIDSTSLPIKMYSLTLEEESYIYSVTSHKLDSGEQYFYRFSYESENDSTIYSTEEVDIYTHIVESSETTTPRRFNNEDFQKVHVHVNMDLIIKRGIFIPSVDSLDIAGTFNNWGEEPVFLEDLDEDGIYSVTLFDVGDSLEFKTRINQSWDIGQHELDNRGNRKYYLSSEENNIEFWYDNENGNNPQTVFTVNMEKEQKFGNYHPEESIVTLEIYETDTSSNPIETYEMYYIDSSLGYASHLLEEGEDYYYSYSYSYIEDSTEFIVSESDIFTHTVDSIDNYINRDFDNLIYQVVTLNANMTLAIEQGRFNPEVDQLDIAGPFNEWGINPTFFTDEDNDGIYSISLYNVGDTLEFKTRINQSWGFESHELVSQPNRIFIIDQDEVIIDYWYDDENGDNPATTLAVNLEKELYLELLDSDSSHVWLNIYEGLDVIKSYHQLITSDTVTTFYFTSHLLMEGENYNFNFSYMMNGDSVDTYENIFRTYTVGTVDSTLVYAFNDKPLSNLVINVNMNWAIESGTFNPETDTLDLAGNFNNWGSDWVEYMYDDDQDGIYSTVLHELDTLECKARINQSWDADKHELANTPNRKFIIINNQETINYWYDDEVGDHPTTTISIDMAKEVYLERFTNEMLYIEVLKNDSTLLKRYLASKSEDGHNYTVTSKLKDDGEKFTYQAVFFQIIDSDSMNIISEDAISSLTVGEETRSIQRWFNNDALVTSITLSVDMSAKIAQGLFDPSSDYVDVAGTFNNWMNDSGDFTLTTDDSNIYQITFDIDSIATYNFKFRINGSWNDLLHEFPGNGALNRSITPLLGINNAFMYYFNNEIGENPEVLLKVNMDQQITLGNFDPTIEGAEVRIKFSEGGSFSSYPLQLNDDGLYGIAFNKFATGETYNYKFMYQYPNGDSWTVFEENIDRSFDVGEGQQTTSVWYNDEAPEERIIAVWSVNMQQIINTNGFDITTDVLTMQGSFDNWEEVITLEPIANGASLYTTSISLPVGRIYYKLFINGEEETFLGQDESDNRFFDLSSENSAINVVYQFEEVATVEEEQVIATETEEGTVEVVIDVEEVIAVLGEEVTFSVMLADGSPLPDWIIFDPETMTFTIDPSKIPAGERIKATVEDLDIIILANNEEGESMAIEVNLPVDEYINNITSLEDVLTENIRLYPTLIDRTLNISIDVSLKNGISYQVIDVQGRNILNGVEKGNFKVDFKNVQAGMYLIKLQSGDQSSIYKVIKQ